MTVFLLLYLCADVSRTNCQAIPVQRWIKSDAYEQCLAKVSGLTADLTAENRLRHRFVCEIQVNDAQTAEHRTQPAFIHQSFRM